MRLPLNGALGLLTVATAATREEVKAARIGVNLGSFGLFSRVSVLNSTGASYRSTSAHDLYLFDHLLPLFPTSYA